MNRSNPAILFGFFVAIIVAMCGVGLLKGGLFIGKHEGDTYHVLQIVFRMAQGQVPHLDFMTPIGALAFAPVALFVKLGYGVGSAFIAAQALVSAVFLPGVWWAAHSRMRGALPFLFGLFVLVMLTALVHGEAHRSISISMHYNRWAWGAAFVAIGLAVLPNTGRPRPMVDGVVIGLAMSALLMLKMTYFVAFFVPVSLAMVLRENHRALLISVLTGLVIVGIVTFFVGIEYWPAYIGDLMTVAGSDIRAAPSQSFGAVIGAPAYIAGSLALLIGVVLLRQGGEAIGGLVLMLLVPGFFYVTYQNFANDPQWLLLLSVILLTLQPSAGIKNGFGWDVQYATRTVAMIALSLSAPSFLNLAYSPFRHLNINVSDYAPMLPKSSSPTNLQANIERTIQVTARIPMDGPGSPYEAYAALANRKEPSVFRGETLNKCELNLGMTTWFQATADDLEASGFTQGKGLFVADVLSSLWLFGSTVPLQNGAPWYYGGLPGIDSADFVLVPLCPIVHAVRDQILKDITMANMQLKEVRRTPLFILFEINR